MGCWTTDCGAGGGFGRGINMKHCPTFTPPTGQGVTMTFGHASSDSDYEHPMTNLYCEDGWCRDCIPYQGRVVLPALYGRLGTASGAAPSATASDSGIPVTKTVGTATVEMSHFPTDLGFEPIVSDDWFYYFFDTANHKVGVPSYLLKTTTCTETSSSTQTTTRPGGTGTTGPSTGTGSTTTTTTTTAEKIPMNCPCTIKSTSITYTTPDDTTLSQNANRRDKYPLLWTAHTTSMSIAFEYVDAPTGPGAKVSQGVRVGDKVNGWTVKQVKHTSLYFNKYHIIELEGTGNAFTYNTVYVTQTGPGWTSYPNNTNMHEIRVKAGQGIKDKAVFCGRFEFRKKEIQYCVARLRPDMKTDWNYEVREPVMTPTVVAGRITSVTVDFPGEGYEKFYPKPDVYAVPPEKYSTNPQKYKEAKFKANWTGGTLQSVEVIDGGFGYSGTPTMGVVSADKIENRTIWPSTDPKKNPNTNLYEKAAEQLDADTEKEVFLGTSVEEETKRANFVNESQKDVRLIDALASIEIDKTRVREHFLEKQKGSAAAMEPIAVNPIDDAAAQYLMQSEDDRLQREGFRTKKDIDELNELEKFHQYESITEEKKVYYKENKVYTICGSFFDLPCATENTKYMLKQFKNDARGEVSTNITLSVEVEPGCSPHPTVSSSGTGGGSSSIPGVPGGIGLSSAITWTCCDGTTGSAAGGTTSSSSSGTYPNGTTYTSGCTTVITGPHGEGCHGWSVSGNLRFLNNLTMSSNTWEMAIAAYGNPYDALCPKTNVPTISVPFLQ